MGGVKIKGKKRKSRHGDSIDQKKELSANQWSSGKQVPGVSRGGAEGGKESGKKRGFFS